MGQEKPPALSPNRSAHPNIMQTLLNLLRILLEPFLCPWPRLEYAGISDFHHLTETSEEKPSLAVFSFGGKKNTNNNYAQQRQQAAPQQQAAAAWTPPPVPAPQPIPTPDPIPPPATTSASDAAAQQADMARQQSRRRGMSRTLLAGESNQPGNSATGSRTLLG